MMLISDPVKMEKLVRRHRNLIWDEKSPNGYDVLMTVRHPRAAEHKNARFVKGKWWDVVPVPLTRNGWELPNEFRKA